MNDRLTAIILAGGRSSRFGSNKANATLGGHTLLERAVRACREVADEVLVVLAPEQAELELPSVERFKVVRDREAFEGPLSGLLTGLEAADSQWCVACTCDAPAVQPAVLELLAGQREEGILAVLPEIEGRALPFPSIVSKAARDALRRDFDGGERRVRLALERLPHVTVSEHDLREADPGLWSFRNVNTQDDLAVLGSDLSLAKSSRGGMDSAGAGSTESGTISHEGHP